MRTFTIASGRVGPRRWCRVRIHPTVEELRVHAQRLNPRVGADVTGGGWADCFGCFQPPPQYMIGDPGWAPNGYAGTLRLADGHINSEIVAHELVHAAAQVYRMNVASFIQLGPSCRRREEDLAYIYGELYASFEAQWLTESTDQGEPTWLTRSASSRTSRTTASTATSARFGSGPSSTAIGSPIRSGSSSR